jgi:hemolysin III
MTTPVESHASSASITSIGLAYFSIATVRLLHSVVGGGSPILITQASAYMACSLFFWITQMAYHIVLRTGRQNIALRNVDRGSVFFLIAGTYTPLVAPSGTDLGATLLPLIVLWGCAAGGMALLLSWKAVPRKVTPLVSLFMVVVGIIATVVTTIIGKMVAVDVVVLFIAGAVLFFAGGAMYAIKKPNPFPGKLGFHELYHALVLVGTILLHMLIAIVVMM